MDIKSKKKSMLCTIVASYIVFMAGWYLRETYIDFSYVNPYLEACINFVIYGIWWIGFAFLLIHCFGTKLNWNLKEILTKSPHWKTLLKAIPIILGYYFICWGVAGFRFSLEMNWLDYLLTVVGVGFFEESVFRGWFYNAWSTIVKEKYANIIQDGFNWGEQRVILYMEVSMYSCQEYCLECYFEKIALFGLRQYCILFGMRWDF